MNFYFYHANHNTVLLKKFALYQQNLAPCQKN